MISFDKRLSQITRTSPDPEVMISQMTAMVKQGPLLYCILSANVATLAFTHYDIAPHFMTLVCPGLLICGCLLRAIACMRFDETTFTAEQARTRLRLTCILVGIIGTLCTAWAFALYPYGDAYLQSHVAFFLALNTISCLFCMMHLRVAAVLVATVVVIPFSLRFATSANPVLAAITINFVVVLVGLLGVLFRYNRDFVSLVHSRRDLAALSDLDSLTGLPNRRSFFRELGALVAAPADSQQLFIVGLIDLDGFKPVNDVYGHVAGDRVLIEVGRRLRATLGPAALLARLGGDEFGIVLRVSADGQETDQWGEAICRAVQAPIYLANGTAQVAASIGFASSATCSSPQMLVERADYALYHAKAQAGGKAVVFSEHHENAIHVQSLVEHELRRADFAVEVSLHYQPIIDVGSNRVTAYEALARWRTPLLGNVAPRVFIAAAERTGLINRLTEALFAKALTTMESWPADIDLSFNLSARDIASPALVAKLMRMIEVSGIAAKRICFEITETAVMHDFEQARETLLKLKASGIQIALDDFGTGYSSLNAVHRLPLDKIKIDRGFIADVTTNKACRDIVKSIIDLGRNLRITCVVEGMETPEQVMILRSIGCTTMQGYFFGRPTDEKSLIHRLDAPLAPVLAPVPRRTRKAAAVAAG